MIASHSYLHSTLERLEPVLESTAQNLLRHLQDDPIAQAQGTFLGLEDLHHQIAHALSLVGEFNTRVKSKQQYWNRPSGAESILQLRAALLSEDDRLTWHFANRPGNLFRKKRTAEPESTSTTAQTAA